MAAEDVVAAAGVAAVVDATCAVGPGKSQQGRKENFKNLLVEKFFEKISQNHVNDRVCKHFVNAQPIDFSGFFAFTSSHPLSQFLRVLFPALAPCLRHLDTSALSRRLCRSSVV